MNREFDREIDALLRRHTRAAVGGRVPDDEGAALSPQSGHLDADELSAFAENALPAPARSLYVSHLADCAECRHAVAGLARTSNVPAESERQAAAVRLETSEPSARGGWLSALFSPRVLRYAFPALALCLVGVLAFVALRSTSRQEAGQVAQHNEPEDNAGRADITRQAQTAAPSGIAAPGDANQNANASMVSGGAASDQTAKPTPTGEQQGPVQGVLKGTNANGPAPTSAETFLAPPPAPPASADAQETVGVVVEAAPKTVSKEKGEEAKMRDAASRERQSDNSFTYNQSQNQAARAGQPRKVDIDQAPDGSRNTQQRSESQQAGGRAADNTLPMLSRGAGEENDRGAATASRRSRPAAPRDRREDEEPAAGAETRSVSNHRFRRQGGVWVDVKYSTSLPTTGVRRGSEGYRALVADIPELGRIAEQFAGETVVVVVKGRAYRIR